MNSLKATAILCAYALFLWLAMPGISFLKTDFLRSQKSQVKFEEKYGSIATRLAVLAGDINRYRRPIAEKLGGFQPVFRMRQSWHLYRDGPRTIRRMEIRVNGKTRYRTGHDDFNWKIGVFRNRRIRPMAETFTKKPKASNPMGLMRYIVSQAREDFPEAEHVEIRALWGLRGQKQTVHHRVVATAPDWTLERQK